MSQVNVDQLSALLLPALIILGIAIVALAGWLIWAFTHPKDEETQPGTDAPAAVSDPSTPCFLGVRRGNRGGWQISVEGRPYATLDAVSNSDTRAQVIDAIRALATFAGYAQQRTASAPQPSTAQPVAASTGTASAQRRDARSSAATSAPAQRGAVPPSIDLTQEIGEIIDEMMARRPDLQGHAVSLQNAPGRGITFVVDGTIYPEIQEIPNPEIQSLIRNATKEWERR